MDSHRLNFNRNAFGTTFQPNEVTGETLPSSRKWKKLFTKDEYEQIWRLVKYWDVVEGHIDPTTNKHISQVELKKSAKSAWFNDRLHFRINEMQIPGQTESVQHLQRYNPRRDIWRVVLHEELVFDAINLCHTAARHRKLKGTFQVAASTYDNITQDLCKLFIETCPTCSLPKQNILIPNRHGRFRDILTVCLIDYSHETSKNSGDVYANYLLVLRDKATEYTILRPVNNKQEPLLRSELMLMLSMFGCPKKKIQCSAGLSLIAQQCLEELGMFGCTVEKRYFDEIVSQVTNTISQLQTTTHDATWSDKHTRERMCFTNMRLVEKSPQIP
jgi:hypothetical protein